MARWKTSPRIDEALCRRIEALQREGVRVPGLATFLKRGKHDPEKLFPSLGFPAPTAFTHLDDARLSNEATRLCKVLAKRPELRKYVASRLNTDAYQIAACTAQLTLLHAEMKGAPAKARARVARYDKALAQFRVAALRAGVKIRGLS